MRTTSILRLLVAACASALSLTLAAVGATLGLPIEQRAGKLTASYAAANAALMKGDARSYMAGVGGLTPDFVLMSPFGGEPSRAAEYTAERIDRMGRFFRNGTFDQQVIATYTTKDMVVLATIERAEVEVGGLPRQPWALRVTSVFVRRSNGWSLAHRHADPLAVGISLEQAAALGRGAHSG